MNVANMEIRTVKCPICSYESITIVEHMREVHKLSPNECQKQFPKNPLASPDFSRIISSLRDKRRSPLKESKPLAEINSRPEMVNVSGNQIKVPNTRFSVDFDDANTDFFPMDPHYVPPAELEKFAWAWRGQRDTYIFGESGLGKSHMVKFMSSLTHKKVVSVNSHGDAAVGDLYGYNTLDEKNSATVTGFRLGALPESMSRGVPLLIEELDRMPARVTTCLHNAMSDRELFIPEAGKLVKAKPGWFIVATGNTNSKGDSNGRYPNAEVMDAALVRRFTARIEMKPLTDSQMLTLLERKAPTATDTQRKAVIKLSTSLREAAKTGSIESHFGNADCISFCTALKDWTPKEAFMITFGETLTPEEQIAATSYIDAVFGKQK